MTQDELDALTEAARRMVRGIDCTEDESALVKRAFDELPAFHPTAIGLAHRFPTEFAEWGAEVERGDRTWNARST